MMPDDFFRASVAACITNGEGSLLVGERRDRPGAWQAPQGGIGRGESTLEALWRELEEEIGLGASELELLEVFPEWLAYELPEEHRGDKTGRGQVQKWHLLRYDSTGTVPEPPTDGEFNQLMWVAPDDFVEAAWEVRKPIYRRLVAEWSAHLR